MADNDSLVVEVPGHRQMRLTQTLIERLLKTHFCTAILPCEKSKQSRIELVTRSEPKQPNKSNAFTLLMAKKTKETGGVGGQAGCDAGVVAEASVPKKRGRPKKNKSDKGEIESDKASDDVTENEPATRSEGIDEPGVWPLEPHFTAFQKKSTQF